MASESKTLIFLALIANGLIAVIKFIAAAISGSSAMLAEGFHSVADTGNQLFLLRGSAVSRYGATVKHPFGRGKELYFWSFMVAVFLFVGGSAVAVVEGFSQLRNPHEDEAGLLFSLIVLAIAALFEIFIAFRPALKLFNEVRGGQSTWTFIRESKDPALLVVVFEDSAAVLGLVIAAAGLTLARVTGVPQWDGVASILIGILLGLVALLIAIEMKALLVGEAATRRERSLIRLATLGVPEVASIGRLLTMQLAPHEILVNMEVQLDPDLSSMQAEAAIDAIEQRIGEVVPEATRVFIELESRRV